MVIDWKMPALHRVHMDRQTIKYAAFYTQEKSVHDTRKPRSGGKR